METCQNNMKVIVIVTWEGNYFDQKVCGKQKYHTLDNLKLVIFLWNRITVKKNIAYFTHVEILI